jgi:uncharacterized integral membrane protein (TIGR00698 family)
MWRPLLPGLLLATLLALAGHAISAALSRAAGRPVLDAIVVALLLGMAVRHLRPPSPALQPGIRFGAQPVLEFAVLLLGLSVDLPMLLAGGPMLAIGIPLLVVVAIVAGVGIGRVVGLPPALAVLVACGNAVCGNSAIAAVARAIGADDRHVASAVAFTAVAGLGLVLVLPLLADPLGLTDYGYGVVAGASVYAVPQVVAAALPVSVLSAQVATLTKLVRVLMLGPVVLFFALRSRRGGIGGGIPGAMPPAGVLMPWFVAGFLVLAAARSLGLVPAPLSDGARTASAWLTAVAMAALGLGVDLRAVRATGRPLLLAVLGGTAVVVLLALGLAAVAGGFR